MRRGFRLAAVLFVIAVAACWSSDDGRPSDAEWAPIWEAQRDSVPAAEVFVDRGEDLCGELVGELRSGRQRLLPTPTEELDNAVHAWVADAESIAFDCPTGRPDAFQERLHDLDILAAEVDAGLAADQAP